MALDLSLVLTSREAAALLGVSMKTLATWRHRKVNLPYRKVNNQIFYRRADVIALQTRREAERRQLDEELNLMRGTGR